jgi:hypothetical protein
MVIAFIVVVAVVVVAATGRGGELSVERGDYAPLDLGPVSATDVALLRPPTGAWGYSMPATEEALQRVAEAIRQRDIRIVALEQLVTDLSRDHAPTAAPLASPNDSPYDSPYASPYSGARHRRTPPEDSLSDATQADTQPDIPRSDPDRAVFDTVSTESVRLPFDPVDPGRPGGDTSGPPPERSHD